VVAPYEADAQLCFLEREGYVDGIITEDSDLLVFGCKQVGVLVSATWLVRARSWSMISARR
jgi:exonuclease-1